MRRTITRLCLFSAVVPFAAYTGWITWEFGYTSVFAACFSAHPSTQALVDLFLCGGLLALVMVADNTRSGRSVLRVLPFLVITLVFAALGPLLYFLAYPELLVPASASPPQRLVPEKR